MNKNSYGFIMTLGETNIDRLLILEQKNSFKIMKNETIKCLL